MIFNNYQELIKHILSFNTKQKQLDAIIQYFMDNVEFDYVMIEHYNQLVSPRFASYVDRLFPNTNNQLRLKAVNYVRNSSNISNEYWNRLAKIYLTPINLNNTLRHFTMVDTLKQITPSVITHNHLLKRGVSSNITWFAKQLCDDCNINCVVINGISSGKMEHNWLNIEINGIELFYDIAFAIYSRDNFCGMARYSPSDWLGITAKTLYKNQPTRTILNPKGFNLKHLALNNLPIKMLDIDTGA